MPLHVLPVQVIHTPRIPRYHRSGNSDPVSKAGGFLYGIKTFYNVYCMLIFTKAEI